MKLLAVCLCTAMLAAGCGGVTSAVGGEADAPVATGAEGAVRALPFHVIEESHCDVDSSSRSVSVSSPGYETVTAGLPGNEIAAILRVSRVQEFCIRRNSRFSPLCSFSVTS